MYSSSASIIIMDDGVLSGPAMFCATTFLPVIYVMLDEYFTLAVVCVCVCVDVEQRCFSQPGGAENIGDKTVL